MSGDAQTTKAEFITEPDVLREKVTELNRDRMFQALDKSEERFRIVTEICRDAVEIANEAGETIYVNPAVEEVFGYTPEDCLGRKMEAWFDIIHPDDRDRIRKEYEGVKKRNETVYYTRMRCRHKDGSWRWIKAVATSYLSVGGERCIMEVTHDITEQVEAEQRRQKLSEQTEEARRLESLGRLAGGIAHDFNNILVAVMGYSDLALHKLSPSSPARPLIEQIVKSGQRATDLCSQMLAYSGNRQLAVAATDLNEVIEDMSKLLEVSVSKQAVLEYEFAANLPAIDADVTQLRQVVMNLVINASEAIGEKSGVIRVSTGAMECDSDYLNEHFFAGKDIAESVVVCLDVSDTGCGMDEETKGKIFDPFYTTKFTGRGLGLATVLGIVRSHKGVIETYSEPGKGTTIKVLFPASQQPAEALAGEAPPSKDWRGSGTILLVDDEGSILDVGSMMLRNVGFEVRTATDGREAVEVFRQHQDEIIGVVLDLMMPNMDGEETLRELRRIREDVKVVFSSGYHEQDVAERLADTSFAGFVKKPYTSKSLIELLRQALEGDGAPS